jgi:hypothetical protein
MSAQDEPSSVSTTLLYFTPPADGSKPWLLVTKPDPALGIPWRNFEQAKVPIEIRNLRGRENSVSLDKEGFQYGVHPAKHTTFANDAEIEAEYYPESVELLKQVTGASRVVLFDHTIRRRRPGVLEDGPDKRQPVTGVHVDQTAESATARVHRHLPPTDAPELLRRRFQIINLWRPISHAAYDWPLALCDYTSINFKEDLVPSTLVYPDRKGETFAVKHNPNHRWNYVRGMRPDEYVLIKCFDSKEGVSILTPHTAFEDPSTPADAPLRESIELRALVFYD